MRNSVATKRSMEMPNMQSFQIVILYIMWYGISEKIRIIIMVSFLERKYRESVEIEKLKITDVKMIWKTE